MYSEKIWKKSWDDHVKDLDPKEWELSFADALRNTFENLPEKMAFDYLGVKITYKQLDELSNQFANMLLKNDFEKGDIVGICLPNTPEYVIALVGAIKIGCVVSGVSPLMSDVQIHYQLNDLSSSGNKVALITLDAIFEGHITKIADKLPQLKVIVATSIVGFFSKLKAKIAIKVKKLPKGKITPLKDKVVLDFHKDIIPTYSKALPKVDVTPDDVIFIQYTGGTTGPPKGAVLLHRNFVSDVIIFQKWLQWERGKGIGLSGFPFFHIAGVFTCANVLWLGWSQILIPNPRDTDRIIKMMDKYNPNILANVPVLYQMMLKNPKFMDVDHSKIDVLMSAAAPFPKESQEILESVVGKGKLLELYGMTETSPLTICNPSRGKKMLGHIGLPLPNTDVKLVDEASGQEVAIGEPGEICVRGPMVMKGYFNKPEETKKAIDKDGYMHTGDVGIMNEEGYFKVVDRTKDMIIVGGFKVFSAKLEDVLTQHPAVSMVATIGVPNPERPGSELVKAFIQLSEDYSNKKPEDVKEEIIAFAKENCAPYEVPKMIDFIDELPLTTVGKVDKKVLRPKKE